MKQPRAQTGQFESTDRYIRECLLWSTIIGYNAILIAALV